METYSGLNFVQSGGGYSITQAHGLSANVAVSVVDSSGVNLTDKFTYEKTNNQVVINSDNDDYSNLTLYILG